MLIFALWRVGEFGQASPCPVRSRLVLRDVVKRGGVCIKMDGDARFVVGSPP